MAVQPGARIRLTNMPDDPCPIPVGTTGTVMRVEKQPGNWTQIWVDWDIDRSLMLCVPPDEFEVIG